jgi:hypothetical protein
MGGSSLSPIHPRDLSPHVLQRARQMYSRIDKPRDYRHLAHHGAGGDQFFQRLAFHDLLLRAKHLFVASMVA